MPIIKDMSGDKQELSRKIIFHFPVYRTDALKFGGSVKILGIVKRMFSNDNTIRPRKNNSGWTEAVNNHKISNNIPIFRIGELAKNEAIPVDHFGEVKYHNKQQSPNKNNHDHHYHPHHHKTIRRKIIDEIENYCDKTTLHGLRYVGDQSLSFGERFFWFMSFTLAVGFAAYYITNVYEKWTKNPVIISFSPYDASLTDIPFPAITICNMNQAKKVEAERILRNGSIEERKLLNDYCKMDSPINASKDDPPPNWDTVSHFLIKVGQGCEETLRVCEWKMDPISCVENFNNDLTDEGLCCSFNRLPPEYIYRKPTEISLLNQTYTNIVYDWTPEKGFSGISINNTTAIPRRPSGAGSHLGLTVVLDAQVDNYFCSSTSSVGFKIILSNPIEAPKVADFGFLISPGMEARYALVPTIREASEALRSIDIQKRQCYFSNERPLRYYRTYTNRNCRLECQSNYTYDTCGCVPYFLPKNNQMKICGKQEDSCVRKAKATVEDVTTESVSCNCMEGCYEIAYERINSYAKLTNKYGTTVKNTLGNMSSSYVQKNIVLIHLFFSSSNFPIRIKRELNDFTEFLSSSGGLLGLFMGFSFLSLVEVFYYLTVKMMCYAIKVKRKHRKNKLNNFGARPFLETYSERNCRLECQSNYTLSMCGCIPHFLPGDRTVSKCGKQDDECVDDAKENMELTIGNASSCHCLQGCYEVSFTKLASYSDLSKQQNSFNVSVTEEYFVENMVVIHFYFHENRFTRLVKSDLYGFTDFLSNTGGLLGLFMGFSFLSVIEFLYFVTLKVICGIAKKHHKEHHHHHQHVNPEPHHLQQPSNRKLPFLK